MLTTQLSRTYSATEYPDPLQASSAVAITLPARAAGLRHPGDRRWRLARLPRYSGSDVDGGFWLLGRGFCGWLGPGLPAGIWRGRPMVRSGTRPGGCCCAADLAAALVLARRRSAEIRAGGESLRCKVKLRHRRHPN